MPHYGKASRSRLDTCHIDLQVLFEAVIEEWDNSILCGHRGQKDQDKFFDEGKTKVKWPDGKHNKTPSEAVDSVPYPIDWNDRERFIGYGCYVLGVADALYSAGKMKHKVRWGGDWNHTDREFTPQNFNDYPHFELVGVE